MITTWQSILLVNYVFSVTQWPMQPQKTLKLLIYWWFAYDVIKNMIIQITTNLLYILKWAIRSYKVSLYKIQSHLDQQKQSYGSKKLEKLEDFLLCYMGKRAGRLSFAHQHGYCNINVWRFFKLWTAATLACIGISTWNLQRDFKMGLITLRKNFVKMSLISIFDDIIANQE